MYMCIFINMYNTCKDVKEQFKNVKSLYINLPTYRLLILASIFKYTSIYAYGRDYIKKSYIKKSIHYVLVTRYIPFYLIGRYTSIFIMCYFKIYMYIPCIFIIYREIYSINWKNVGWQFKAPKLLLICILCSYIHKCMHTSYIYVCAYIQIHGSSDCMQNINNFLSISLHILCK